MRHYDLPSPLPFVEECDCEEVLLSASNRAFSIFSISARDSICAERLSLLVRISVLSGSSWFRIGVISACTMRWRSACRLFRISSLSSSKSIFGFWVGAVAEVCCVTASVGAVFLVFFVCSVVTELVVVLLVDCLGFLFVRFGNSLGSKVNWNLREGFLAGSALNLFSVVALSVGLNFVLRASAYELTVAVVSILSILAGGVSWYGLYVGLRGR